MAEQTYITQGHLVGTLLEQTEEGMNIIAAVGDLFHIKVQAQKEQQPYVVTDELTAAIDAVGQLPHLVTEYATKLEPAGVAAKLLGDYAKKHFPAQLKKSQNDLLWRLEAQHAHILSQKVFVDAIDARRYLGKKRFFKITYDSPSYMSGDGSPTEIIMESHRSMYKSKFVASAYLMTLYWYFARTKELLQNFMDVEAELELTIAGAVPKNLLGR